MISRRIHPRIAAGLAAQDKNLLPVTGDLGFGVLKPFWETYPDQFINAGIAEQAMTSLAAGLAREGKTVLTYSIGNFPTLRCLEQIRNDCAYHDANVKIVCVGGGFVYGSLGMSHHATEDMAILRALPQVTVFTPGDPARPGRGARDGAYPRHLLPAPRTRRRAYAAYDAYRKLPTGTGTYPAHGHGYCAAFCGRHPDPNGQRCRKAWRNAVFRRRLCPSPRPSSPLTGS